MVQKITARTDDPAGTTGAGADAVESLSALAGEAAALQSSEIEEKRSGSVTVQIEQDRRAQAEQDAAAGEIAALLGVIRDMAAPMVEDAGWLKPGQTVAIWTDAHLQRISGPVIAVLARHGMELGELMAQAGPYLALCAGLLLPGVATLKAVRENKAARSARDVINKAAGEGAAGGQQ